MTKKVVLMQRDILIGFLDVIIRNLKKTPGCSKIVRIDYEIMFLFITYLSLHVSWAGRIENILQLFLQIEITQKKHLEQSI